MKLPGFKSFKSADDAVSVPIGLQKLIVYTMVVSQLIGVLVLFSTFRFSGGLPGWDYAGFIIVFQLLPLLVFGIAYYAMREYKVLLNRSFMAVLYSIAGIMIIYSLQSIKNALSIVYVDEATGSLPSSSWITSYTSDYAIVSIAVIIFAIYMYKYRKAH